MKRFVFLVFLLVDPVFLLIRHSPGPAHKPRRHVFESLEKNFLKNENKFLKNYHEYKGRSLTGSHRPMLISNVHANESPKSIQQTVASVLKANNITGSVIVITNTEPEPADMSVSESQAELAPYRHPYYYNPEDEQKDEEDKIETELNVDANNPYAHLVFPPKPITFRDIPTIMVIANSVGSVYSYYSTFFPKDLEKLPETSTVEKVQIALVLYVKIRVLAKTFYEKKAELQQQISFLGSHIIGLQTSEIDMINFTGLDLQYFNLKTKWQDFQYDTRGSKIKNAWLAITAESKSFAQSFHIMGASVMKIMSIAEKFENILEHINNIIQMHSRKLGLLDMIDSSDVINGLTSASKFMDNLADKTDIESTSTLSDFAKEFTDSNLGDLVENSSWYKAIKTNSLYKMVSGGVDPIEVLNQFDKFMVDLIELVNKRKESQNSIFDFIEGVQQIKNKRDSVAAQLAEIENELNRLQTEDLLQKSSWLLPTWLVLLLFWFFK